MYVYGHIKIMLVIYTLQKLNSNQLQIYIYIHLKRKKVNTDHNKYVLELHI